MTKATTATAATVQPTAPHGVWQNLKTIMQSITDVLTGAARTSAKAVRLVENEIDNLDAEQRLRLEATARLRLQAMEQSEA